MRMGNRFYTSDADNRVLVEIIESGKEGIYQKDILEKIPGIHRSTVNRVADRLEKDKQIKIIRRGRTTKYIARSDPQTNVAIAAHILGRDFLSFSLLGKDGMVLSDWKQEYPYYIDFAKYRQFFEPKFTVNSRLEETLFELSNQVGAFIIYSFIQAMNEDNINRLLLLQQKKNKSKNEAKAIIERENQYRFVTEEWIKNSVSTNLIQMFWRFNHVLEPFGFIPDFRARQSSIKCKKLGYYLLDKDVISKLSKAFSNLYPRLYYELEKIRSSIPGSAISHKEYEKLLLEKYKKQKECKHELSEPKILATSEDGKTEVIVEMCSKCGYKKTYRKYYY